ncbi:winged helix-turn-helix domain-containing protein [Novosphingobium sp.]|uniref:winged helix-turn-helix domain-containing protein n=1 Tax=Novosphingobium sp. TaxID=1874826 RepID=UPI0031D1531A
MELVFGDFTLDTERKMLWRGTSYVPIGHRAFAILAALLESPGHLISKSELFEKAWPGISVDAANLRVQIGNIRRVLGQGGKDIVTEQSLGYSFQGEVRANRISPAAQIAQRFFAPDNLVRPVGREAELAMLDQALSAHRLVSIVGPGGIGKTTLALELARRLDGHFLDGVCFVDLGMASRPEEVIASVAAALQRPVQGEVTADILTCLRTRRLLLVLDCCERVIEAAADLASNILTHAPGVSIVATSRESLRLPGEFVTPVNGLDLPPADVSADMASRFGALALFLRTAAATGTKLTLNAANMAMIADICHRLDGIPLAIDLTASLTGTLGLDAIRDGLDDCISSLALGRRGGIPRHRTLEAAIGWSYDLLSESEALTLQRLSVLADSFTLDDACQVITYGRLDTRTARLAIIALARKSLLNCRIDHEPAVYRLLETTRHFAAARLPGIQDHDELALSHADFILNRLRVLEPTILTLVGGKGAAPPLVKDLRQALGWAWESGRPDLAMDLTLAGESLWLTQGLYREHAAWSLRAHREGPDDPVRQAAALTALAYGVLYDAADEAGIDTVTQALSLARQVGDDFLVMRNLFHGCYYHLIRHRGYEALAFARDYHTMALAAQDDALIAFARVCVAIAQVQTGEWDDAAACFEDILQSPPPSFADWVAIPLGMDVVSLALFELGGLLWVRGMAGRGVALIDQALERAERIGSPQNRFQALAFGGCSSAVLSGDVDRLRFYLRLLEAHAREFALWAVTAQAYRGCLAWFEGRFTEARDLLEAYFATGVPSASLDVTFLTILAETRLKLGEVDGAEGAILEAWDRRSSEEDPFVAAQFHRVQADLVLAREGSDDSARGRATDLYRRSITIARTNRTLAFEIPSALALARLELDRGRTGDALDGLNATLAGVTASADLPALLELRELVGVIEGLPHT